MSKRKINQESIYRSNYGTWNSNSSLIITIYLYQKTDKLLRKSVFFDVIKSYILGLKFFIKCTCKELRESKSYSSNHNNFSYKDTENQKHITENTPNGYGKESIDIIVNSNSAYQK